MSKMTKALNALMPRSRVAAMQARAMGLFRDSAAQLCDDAYAYLLAILRDQGSIDGAEMREDAVINNEKQFGISPPADATLTERIAVIEAAWGLVGWSGPGYIEFALQRLGFDVAVVENIPANSGEGGEGYVLGNGLLLQDDGTTVDPIILPTTGGGTPTQFGTSGRSFSTFGTLQFGAPYDDWWYVFTVEGSDGNPAQISSARRSVFEREILRLKPAHTGVHIRAEYV